MAEQLPSLSLDADNAQPQEGGAPPEADAALVAEYEALEPPEPEAELAPAPEPDLAADYDALASLNQESEALDVARLGTLLRTAKLAGPEEAQVQALATELGAKVGWVRERFPQLQAARARRGDDARRLLQEEPLIARQLLAEPEKAPGTIQALEQVSPLVRAFRGGMKLLEWGQKNTPMGTYSSSGAMLTPWEEMELRGGDPSQAPPTAEEAFPRPKLTEQVRSPAADATGLRRPWHLAKAEWEQSQKQVQLGREGMGAMVAFARGDDAAGYAALGRAHDLQLELAPRFYDANAAEQVLLDGVSVAGSSLEGLKGGGVGYALGATAGLVVGLATRNPGMGFAVAKEAGSLGRDLGAFAMSAHQEMGTAFPAFVALKTDDGRPMDRDVAMGAAIFYGLLSAAVEVDALKTSLGMFGKAGDALAGRTALKAGMEAALKSPAFRARLADASRRWVTGALAEGKEEAIQGVMQDAFGWAGKATTAALHGDGTLLDNTLEGLGQRRDVEGSLVGAFESAVKGTSGALALGAARASFNSAATVGAELYRQGKERLGQRRAALLAKAAENPSVAGAASMVAELVKQASAEQGEEATHLYADPEAVQRFLQEVEGDPAAAAQQLLGPDAAALLQQAAITGEKVAVPVAQVLGAWGKLGAAQRLAGDLTTHATGLTAREQERRRPEIAARAKAIREAFRDPQKAPPPAAGSVEERLVNEVAAQLVAAGTHTPAEARAALAPQRAFIHRMALHYPGKTLDELFRTFELKVQSRAQAKAAAAEKAKRKGKPTPAAPVPLTESPAAPAAPSASVSSTEAAPAPQATAVVAEAGALAPVVTAAPALEAADDAGAADDLVAELATEPEPLVFDPTDLRRAFDGAGDVAPSLARDAWARVAAGKRILFSELPGTLEAAMQTAVDRREATSEAELLEVVRAFSAPGQAAPEANSQIHESANSAPEPTPEEAQETLSAREEGLALISRMRPDNRALAEAWVAYVDGQTDQRPTLPSAMRNKLAAFGIVDPEGFDGDMGGPQMDPQLRRGKTRGEEEPEHFRRAREDNQALRTGEQSKRYSQQDVVPDASRELFAAWADAPLEERARRLYVDRNTGLVNARAFALLKDPERPLVAELSIEGTKRVNDRLGHEAGNAFYRLAARAIAAAAPGLPVGKVGGDFALRVRDEAELQAVLARVNRDVALQGYRVTGAAAGSLADAHAAHVGMKTAGETDGSRAPRGERPAGALVDVDELSLPAVGVEGEALPPALYGAVAAMPEGEAFAQTYVEEATGLLTGEGFFDLPRKAFQASIDLNGLKGVNGAFGEAFGDLMLQAFGRLVTQLGGADFDAAHLHGDEYALQSDDRAALEAFVARLADVGAAVTVRARSRSTGEVLEYAGLPFGVGIGETYDAADQALNAHKQALSDAGLRGDAATQARLRRGPGGDAARGPGAAGAEGGGGDAVEGGGDAQPGARRGQGYPGRAGPDAGRVGSTLFQQEEDAAPRRSRKPRAQTATAAFRAWFRQSKVVDAKGKPLRVFHGTQYAGFDAFDPKLADPNGLYGPGFYFTEDAEVAGTYTDKAARLNPEAPTGPAVYPVFLSLQQPFDASAPAKALVPQLQKFRATAPPFNIRRMIDAAMRDDSTVFSADGVGSWIDNTEWAYNEAAKLEKNGEELVLPHFDYIVGKARDHIVREIRAGEMKTGQEVVDFIERNVFPVMQDGAANIPQVLRMLGFDGITHIGGNLMGGGEKEHRVWIAFDPEQVKSASGNRGTFDPSDSRILYQSDEDTLQGIKEDAKREGLKLDVSEREGSIILSRIVVPEAARGSGTGTRFMARLAVYADSVGKTIGLTPSTDFGASSKARLVEFYKRLGFKENKGRSRDLSISESMVREPLKGDEARNAAAWAKVLFQRAFHGTPHKRIERFSLDKIGTGEGAQVYGWGLYFAGKRAIAEWYRENLSGGYTFDTGADGLRSELVARLDTRLEGLPDGKAMEARLTELLLAQGWVVSGGARVAVERVRFDDSGATIYAKDDQGPLRVGPFKRSRLVAELAADDADLARDAQALDAVRGNTVASLRDTLQRLPAAADTSTVLDMVVAEIRGSVSGSAERWLAKFDEEQGTDLAALAPRLKQNDGALHTVEVPEDGELLDYDAPLMEQPQAVLEKLESLVPGLLAAVEHTRAAGGILAAGPSASVMLPDGDTAHVGGTSGGMLLYAALSQKLGGDRAASEALRAAGIPGLRYLDAASRTAPGEGGTHNFVVWDEAAVEQLEVLEQGDDASDAADAARGFVEIRRGSEAGRRLFNVVLNPTQNWSTALHEFGHVYLEMFGELAQRPDAPAALKADWATTLEWMGVKDAAGIETSHHELWARTWETWLREGVAPSPTLERAFQRFKLWLEAVYDSAKRIGGRLSPEIQGVFERLLATDEEIARARNAAGAQPVFRTPEEAGMNPQEWEAYLQRQERALSRAATATRVRALRDRFNETEAWWRKGLREEEARAGQEYAQRQDVRAHRFLSTGQLDDSPATGPIKLDPGAVLVNVGEEGLRKLARLVKKGGTMPSDVLGPTGYPTPKALLEALVAMPEREAWVEARAREVMEQRHPDVLRQRAQLEAAAQAELHAEPGAAVLLEELAFLRRRVRAEGPAGPNGRAPLADAPVESIQRAAREMVAGQVCGVLNPHRALVAERAAASRVVAAVARREHRLAYTQQQQRLLNHYRYAELSRAVEERTALQELARELGKDASRGRLGKAALPLRDAVDGLLEGLGLVEPRPRDEPLQVMADLAAAEFLMGAAGDSVAFDVRELGRLLGKVAAVNGQVQGQGWTLGGAAPAPAGGWKKALTVAEMRTVLDALRNLRQASRNLTTVLVEGRRVEKDAIVAELVQEAALNLPDRGDAPRSRSAMGPIDKLLDAGAELYGETLKASTFIASLTGGKLSGVWHRAIMAPIQAAKQRQADLMKQVVAPIVSAMEHIPQGVRARMRETIDGRALFPNHREGVAAPTQRWELLMMALNMGNDSNQHRLLEGSSITEAQMHAALELLTREEWDWVQTVWNACDALWPLAKEVEERDAGVAPPRIQPRPILTKFGSYPGGYFPAVYDNRFSRVGEQQAAQTVAAFLDPSFVRPGTPHSHLKQRAEVFADVIMLEPTIIGSHLLQVVHDVAYREAIKSVGSLLVTPEVQDALRSAFGTANAGQLKSWLQAVGHENEPVATQARAMTRLARALRNNLAVAQLGYSVKVAFGDFANITAAFARGPKVELGRALVAMGRVSVEGGRFRCPARERALELSGELRFRQDEVTRHFTVQLADLTKSMNWGRRALAWYKRHAFVLFEAVDAMTATPIWLASYNQALKEGLPQAQAVAEADAFLQRQLPSNNAADQAAVLRNKGWLGTSLMFYGYLSTQLNEVHRTFQQQLLPARRARGGRRVALAARGAAVATAQAVFYLAAANLLAEWIGGRGQEDDEKLPEWMARKLTVGAVSLLPFGGEVAALGESLYLERRPTARQQPALAWVGAIGRALWEAQQDKDDQQVAVEVGKALGTVYGLPVQPLNWLDFAADVATGQESAAGPLDAASGAVYGRREGSPSNPLGALSKAAGE